MASCSSHAAFKILSLTLMFDILIIMFLDLGLLGSSYLGLSGIPGLGCLFPFLLDREGFHHYFFKLYIFCSFLFLFPGAL